MLKVHFLNVGEGSCTIVDFPSGRLSIVDIDTPSDNSLTNPSSYLATNFPGRNIFRFILTHPDMDHMTGLNNIAKSRTIVNFWDTDNDEEKDESGFENTRYDKKDWDRYQQFRGSRTDPKCLNIYRDQVGDYWEPDNIYVLAPRVELVKAAKEAEDYHHSSYVLGFEYKGIKVLLGGDASPKVWGDILEKKGKDALKADIFLAPHHGSENNIHKDAFAEIEPEVVIVSVAEGKDYAQQYYKNLASQNVLSTKRLGDIWLEIDNEGSWKISWEKDVEL